MQFGLLAGVFVTDCVSMKYKSLFSPFPQAGLIVKFFLEKLPFSPLAEAGG